MLEFTVFYIIFCFCFVFPPSAFISVGLTVPNILDSWLGSEDLQFVQYQLKRTAATIIVHSILPLGYFGGLALSEGIYALLALIQNSYSWLVFLNLCLLLPLFTTAKVFLWTSANWQTHPLVKSLTKYATNNSSGQWKDVAAEINSEFRRIDKVIISTNPITKTVITNSWIIKVDPYTVKLARQSDVQLQLENSEEHNFTNDSQTAQYLSVWVEHVQSHEKLFSIRLNAVDYLDMQDRLQSPVNNVRGVVINQDIHARFLKAFVEEVNLNPIFQSNVETEPCLGCAVNRANVTLVRRCTAEGSGCVSCFCRPMWCITCLSKWFSARQDSEHPETWLSSRCPCPTCRSPFCILDVSLVEHVEDI